MLGRQLEQLYPDQHSQPQDEAVLGLCGLEGQGQLELFLSLYGVIRARGSLILAVLAGTGLQAIQARRMQRHA